MNTDSNLSNRYFNKVISHFLMMVLLFLLQAFLLEAKANLITISKARAWTSPDKTRLVFELNKKADYKAFVLSNPSRLIIDLKQAEINDKVLANLSKNHLIKQVRQDEKTITAKKQNLRVVFDLSSEISKIKDFTLSPNNQYKYRVVIDLYKKSDTLVEKISNKTPTQSAVIKNTDKPSDINNKAVIKQPVMQVKKSIQELPQRDLIIAVDAGHGGEDPGATGRFGKKEKHIVFAIAKKLANKINQQAGMKAVLIRTGDYYVSLRNRTQKARSAKADLFISIHADAFRNAKAKGSSVFILSKSGASSESAKWLATKENSADLAGGVSLDDKDDLLAKVLLDLSQTATIEGSVSVASRILKGLKNIGKVHKKQVERAGFVVLKSPDIPSVLVETGFISNPEEERRLSTSSYQYKMANAIYNGIDDYFRKYPIPGTVYSQAPTTGSIAKRSQSNAKSSKKFHVVKSGDSLSKISKKYNISIRTLKKRNQLRSNTLYIGKKLRLL
ncbi:MAG: N-acetylmuramoyl-L-alanine amidase [Gammaproteobacteria bacterium]|nr:N-acetylmuramoyl-L-alanine amidase [Gammaproteobacteria bacterium]